MKMYSDMIKKASDGARMIAAHYGHTEVSTPHLFLGVIAALNERLKNARPNDEENTNMYANVLASIKRIIANYGVTGDNFKSNLVQLFPPSNREGLNEAAIVPSAEANSVFQILSNDSKSMHRTMGITDLVRELFTDKSYRIRNVLSLIIQDETKVDELCDEIIKEFKAKDAMKIKDLEEITELTNLNEFLLKNPITTIAMDNAVDQLKLALSCKSIKCAMLVGAAGTGKTTAVYEFVNRINNGTIGSGFENKVVYQLDCGALASNTRFRGDLETKVTRLIQLVRQHKNVILFIDEMHTFRGLGGGSDGAVSASDIMKPYITRGELQIIGATTNEEFNKEIAPDKAFARRFHQVHIAEPNAAETLKILVGMNGENEKFFKRKASIELLEKVVEIATTYSIDQANPARAINMLEFAFAHSKVFNEKNEAVLTDDILRAIEIKYDITIAKDRVKKTEDALKAQILGQDDIIKKVVNVLKFVDKGLVDPEKPLASVLFAGSTGTGKTEVSKIVAKNFFGSENNLIRINCNEFADKTTVTKITGAGHGYIGSDIEPALIRLIKQYPNSVVLFDEIEKADEAIYDVLLNILDAGEMTDNSGNRVSFKNAVIIFTTNLGYQSGFSKAKGLGFNRYTTSTEDIEEAIKKNFRPEFINRIEEIITFNSLTKDIAKTLIERYRKEYCQKGQSEYVFTDTDIDEIINRSNIEEYGARGLKRAVRTQIMNVIERGDNTEVPIIESAMSTMNTPIQVEVPKVTKSKTATRTNKSEVSNKGGLN